MSESESIRDAKDDLSDRVQRRVDELLTHPVDFIGLIPESDLRDIASELVRKLFVRSYYSCGLMVLDLQQFVQSWARMFAERDVE